MRYGGGTAAGGAMGMNGEDVGTDGAGVGFASGCVCGVSPGAGMVGYGVGGSVAGVGIGTGGKVVGMEGEVVGLSSGCVPGVSSGIFGLPCSLLASVEGKDRAKRSRSARKATLNVRPIVALFFSAPKRELSAGV